MGWRGSTVVLLVILASVPLLGLPVTAEPACGATATPGRVLQSDAGLPGDASDGRADARPLTLPPPEDGEQGAYYWAWLDPPVPRDGDDVADWFQFTLSPGADEVMLNVTAYDRLTASAYPSFILAIWKGDGTGEPFATTTSAGGTLTFSGTEGGRHTIKVTPGEAYAAPRLCDTAAPIAGGVSSTPLQRNYGAYLGCRPFCVLG